MPTDYKNVESSQLGSDGLHYVSEDKSHAIGLFKMNINKATQATADTDVEPEIAGLNYAKVYEEEGAEVAAGKVDSDIFVNVRYIEGKYADGKVKTVFLFNEKDGNNATVHIISLQGTKDDIEKMFPVVGSWKKTKE